MLTHAQRTHRPIRIRGSIADPYRECKHEYSGHPGVEGASPPAFDLKGLSEIYEQVAVVNRCFHERISDAAVKDAGLNAIAHLNAYAQFNMVLIEEGLAELEPLFRAYTEA